MNKEAANETIETDGTVRLLLHTVDGVIPFLTPSLCQRCFPADEVQDVLSIGIAVRDTCLEPIFDRPKVKKRNIEGKLKQKDDSMKPRGYTFTANTLLDSFVLPYDRIAVPTFDLYDDASREPGGKRRVLLNTDSMNLAPATTTCINLWTPNGRQSITPQQYTSCAIKLDSTATVALFDMIPPGPESHTAVPESAKGISSQSKRWKRSLAVSQRNRCWTDALQSVKSVLTTLAVAHDIDPTPESLDWVAEKIKDGTIQGTAIAGFQYIQNPKRRMQILRSTASILRPDAPSSATIAILSTTTLIQIVELLHFAQDTPGCTLLIGCNLPTHWAQAKRAFVLNVDRDESEITNACQWDSDGCLDLVPHNDFSIEKHPWFRDMSPLVSGCTCMTCAKYSRAYLFHLVCAKELLAEMLLFIHNLYHLLTILRRFNQAQHAGDGALFCKKVKASLG